MRGLTPRELLLLALLALSLLVCGWLESERRAWRAEAVNTTHIVLPPFANKLTN